MRPEEVMGGREEMGASPGEHREWRGVKKGGQGRRKGVG